MVEIRLSLAAALWVDSAAAMLPVGTAGAAALINCGSAGISPGAGAIAPAAALRARVRLTI
jgi:hypothetical protein